MPATEPFAAGEHPDGLHRSWLDRPVGAAPTVWGPAAWDTLPRPFERAKRAALAALADAYPAEAAYLRLAAARGAGDAAIRRAVAKRAAASPAAAARWDAFLEKLAQLPGAAPAPPVPPPAAAPSSGGWFSGVGNALHQGARGLGHLAAGAVGTGLGAVGTGAGWVGDRLGLTDGHAAAAGWGFTQHALGQAAAGATDLATAPIGGMGAVDRYDAGNAAMYARARPDDTVLGMAPATQAAVAGTLSRDAAPAAGSAMATLGVGPLLGAARAGLGAGAGLAGRAGQGLANLAGRAPAPLRAAGAVAGGGAGLAGAQATYTQMDRGVYGALSHDPHQVAMRPVTGPITAEAIAQMPDDVVQARLAHADQLAATLPHRAPNMTPEQQAADIKTIVGNKIIGRVIQTQEDPRELWAKAEQGGWTPDDIAAIERGPDGPAVAQQARAAGTDPVSWFRSLPPAQQVLLGVGVPLAVVGMGSQLLGHGGMGSMLLSLLGLGGVAGGLGLFSGSGSGPLGDFGQSHGLDAVGRWVGGQLGGLGLGGGGGAAPAPAAPAAPAGPLPAGVAPFMADGRIDAAERSQLLADPATRQALVAAPLAQRRQIVGALRAGDPAFGAQLGNASWAYWAGQQAKAREAASAYGIAPHELDAMVEAAG